MRNSFSIPGSAGARIEAESGVEKTDGDPPLKNSGKDEFSGHMCSLLLLLYGMYLHIW